MFQIRNVRGSQNPSNFCSKLQSSQLIEVLKMLSWRFGLGRTNLTICLITSLVACAFAQQPTTRHSHRAATQKSAQPPNDESRASATIDQYLQGMKILELPEGKALIAETQWDVRFEHRSVPIFSGYQTVYQGLFSTDAVGLRGYKRLIDIQGRSEAGTPLTTRYLLVAYKDSATNVWKVLQFTKAQDTEHAAEYFRRDMQSQTIIGSRVVENFSYKHYLYALTLVDAGRVYEAKKEFQQALDLDSQESVGDVRIPKDETQDYIRVLSRVQGQP